jgi:hypothetical protein
MQPSFHQVLFKRRPKFLAFYLSYSGFKSITILKPVKRPKLLSPHHGVAILGLIAFGPIKLVSF